MAAKGKETTMVAAVYTYFVCSYFIIHRSNIIWTLILCVGVPFIVNILKTAPRSFLVKRKITNICRCRQCSTKLIPNDSFRMISFDVIWFDFHLEFHILLAHLMSDSIQLRVFNRILSSARILSVTINRIQLTKKNGRYNEFEIAIIIRFSVTPIVSRYSFIN